MLDRYTAKGQTCSDFYMYSIIYLVEMVVEMQNEFYLLYLRH